MYILYTNLAATAIAARCASSTENGTRENNDFIPVSRAALDTIDGPRRRLTHVHTDTDVYFEFNVACVVVISNKQGKTKNARHPYISLVKYAIVYLNRT